jgi:hypothetical protein
MDAGAPTLRYARHGVRGSLYVSHNHLSATGAYADLRERVPQSRSDHKGYPVWQGPALPAALEEFQARFHP